MAVYHHPQTEPTLKKCMTIYLISIMAMSIVLKICGYLLISFHIYIALSSHSQYYATIFSLKFDIIYILISYKMF